MASRHDSLPLTNMLLEVERPVIVGLHCETLKNIREWKKEGRLKNYIGNLLKHQKKKLISLVTGSKAFDDKEFLDLIQDVCDSCSVCLRFRKLPL